MRVRESEREEKREKEKSDHLPTHKTLPDELEGMSVFNKN